MDGWITIGTKIDTKSFDAQISYIEQEMQDIEDKLKQADMGFEVGDTAKLEAEYEKLGNKLTELIKKQNQLNNAGTNNIVKGISEANKGLTKTIGKVGKWALAIFGIRSAYLGIRQAINYVSQYNDEMANKIETIKSSLAMGLEPILTQIVNTVYTLVQYIGYLAKAWFGVDMFAKRSAKSTQAAAKASKSMAGFDTANKLNDSSSASGSSPMALQPLEEGQIPSWLQWIKDNGAIVAGVITGIATSLLLVKTGIAGLIGIGIGKLLGGVLLIFTGLGIAIQGVINFIKDPSWDSFLQILEGIALVVAGIAVLMGGWVVAIAAVGVAIITYLIRNWDKVKEILGVVGSWIYDHVIEPIGNFFGSLWENIKNGASAAWNFITGVFSKIGSFFTNVWKTIKNMFVNMGTAIGNAFVSAFKAVINAILKSAESILNTPINAINKLINTINTLPGVSIGKLSTFKLPRLAVGGIVNNPGRGVPVGGAIAGEAGREGVLPLTDSNTMAQLGQEIGKWISVNVDLTTKLDSRVLSRSLEKVQSNNSFARNGV